jgi:two-component system OmpR family response regulator
VRQTIAIVEDDVQQRSYYADALRAHDFEVREYESRQAAVDAFQRYLPDLAILDIALNSDVGGGYEVCRFLKERDASLPIIFLTSRGDELDKIYGLQLGAWDYQTKPVSLDYLIVRIESFFQIRAASMNPAVNKDSMSASKKFGDLDINKKSMQCYWQGSEVNLTPTEFSIVSAMATSQEAISIDELIKATRQGVVEDNTINTHILHIRKKFKSIDENFHCIKTRYGLGYQWLCE